MRRKLSRRFFARDADVVARDLLGRLLVRETAEGERLSLRIVETEAYFGPPHRNPQLNRRRDLPDWLKKCLWEEGDPAAHSFSGVTPRNRVMYEEPARAYVYLIYGMHECMNVVTGPDDEPQAVLLRAGEPVEGLDRMIENRGRALRHTDVANGPGKLAQALGITRKDYGRDLTRGALRFEAGRRAEEAAVTARVNVVGGEDLPLRYIVPDSPFVSKAPASRPKAS